MHGGKRLGSTAGQAAAARSSFVQVGPKLRTLDEKVRMASTAMSTSTRALLHCWTREWTWVGGGRDDVLLYSSGAVIAHGAVRMASIAKSASTRALRHCWTRG